MLKGGYLRIKMIVVAQLPLSKKYAGISCAESRPNELRKKTWALRGPGFLFFINPFIQFMSADLICLKLKEQKKRP